MGIGGSGLGMGSLVLWLWGAVRVSAGLGPQILGLGGLGMGLGVVSFGLGFRVRMGPVASGRIDKE